MVTGDHTVAAQRAHQFGGVAARSGQGVLELLESLSEHEEPRCVDVVTRDRHGQTQRGLAFARVGRGVTRPQGLCPGVATVGATEVGRREQRWLG